MRAKSTKALAYPLALLLCAVTAQGRERAQGFCEQGATTVTFPGLGAVAQKVQGSFPSCTVTAFISGFVQAGITSIARSSNVVTATVSLATPSYAVGAAAVVTGVTDTTFNGTFVATSVGTNQLIWNQSGPNASSSGGTVSLLPALFADNAGTPKANPFTADSAGAWFFYSDDGRYDVRFSG